MGLKILWGILLGLWLVFVLMGRGGFIHLLLLCGISVLMIDLVSMYRARGVRIEAGTSEKNEL
ncbi:MAG TPA: hypothetical protein VJ781_03035 [Pyrinomonadaceae bacterium]|nr:hypothetical protein [Pyrinomonadaceae bacterium]